MKQKIKAEWFILAAMAAVIIFFGTYRLTDVGQPILYEDEFGYWSNSSFFIGQNWSGTTGTIAYYSYGYSLLLIPVRLLTALFGWNWRQMYQTMIIIHSLMLTGAFFIAVKLCKRYMADFHWLVRDFACLTVLLYPTYIVYAHITWTETTLAFLFWVFLYVLMRLTDHPTLKNHICFALVSFYMYVVHQRCIAAVIAAVIIVYGMHLLKKTRFTDVVYFTGILFIGNCIHTMIKGKLQNDFYLAKDPAGIGETIGYLLTKQTFILLAAAILCIVCLRLIDQGRGRAVIGIAALISAAAIIYIVRNIEDIQAAANTVEGRMAVNDFAGQIGRIRNVFTLPGFLRLLIGMAGKWFYLASASGLVICFGIWELGKHFIITSWKGIRHIWNNVWNNNLQTEHTLSEQDSARIWLWGAFLGWLGIFGVCSIYVAGIDRVDNLVYGRYHEIAAGILILYGFYSLVKDKRWIRHFILFVTAYLLVGWLCQYLFDELDKTVFEMGHSIMLGLIFKNGQTPDGKIWQTAAYAVAAAALLCIFIKILQEKFHKAAPYRSIVSLLAVIILYAYMGTAMTANYVISVNQRQERTLPTIVMWINRLYGGENIYFLKDTKYYRWGLALQYDIFDKTVILTESSDIPQDEDAFYVAGPGFDDNEEITDKYGVIVDAGSFVLLSPLDGDIYARMEDYYRSY